jgi:hypothetical protein
MISFDKEQKWKWHTKRTLHNFFIARHEFIYYSWIIANLRSRYTEMPMWFRIRCSVVTEYHCAVVAPLLCASIIHGAMCIGTGAGVSWSPHTWFVFLVRYQVPRLLAKKVEEEKEHATPDMRMISVSVSLARPDWYPFILQSFSTIICTTSVQKRCQLTMK